MAPPGDNIRRELVAVVELTGELARELSAKGAIPEEEVQKLKRDHGELVSFTEPGIAWSRLRETLFAVPGVSDHLAKVAGGLTKNEPPAILLLSEDDAEAGAYSLWRNFLIPAVKSCHARCPDWDWDDSVASEAVAEGYRRLEASAEGYKRTIAPLYNFDGPDEAIQVEGDLTIRPFGETEREELWRGFGEDRISGSVRLGDLSRWTHAIDYRWSAVDGHHYEFGHLPGIERVRDVVRAMRLHHRGMVTVACVWTQREPPADPEGFFQEAHLTTPAEAVLHDVYSDEAAFLGVWYPAQTSLGCGDGPPLADLLRRMRAEAGDRRLALALRRFDSAYARHADEDCLIDLWIAFEALLLPDGKSELSYRAALRIAQLAGGEAEERRQMFQRARESYRCRSQVVHGESVKGDLEEVVEQTRELARRVLRAWLLEPPSGGIEQVDLELLD